MKFGITSACSYGGKFSELLWGIEGIVLPKITTQLLACPVMFDPKWMHLQGLHSGDPQFGVPGPIDILLGADIFSHTIAMASGVVIKDSRQLSRPVVVEFWG